MLPIEKILTLVNQDRIPAWWKHCVRLTLMKGSISDQAFELLYKIAQMETGLIEKNEIFDAFNKAVSSVGFEAEESTVTIDSLGPVNNVSALLKDQILTFSTKGMTVVYGDNGVGKSSYSKILKQACLTRGDIPQVAGNIFSGNTEIPSAEIKISINGEKQEPLQWLVNGQSNDHLKTIRVFDSHSATHYVAKEGAIKYKPAGLHILDELTKACQYIMKEVNSDIQSIQIITKLPELRAETLAGKFSSQISYSTTVDEIEQHCATEEEVEQLELLRTQVIEYKLKTSEQLRKDLSSIRKRLEPLSNSLQIFSDTVSDTLLSELKTAYDDHKTKSAAAETLRESTLSNLPLENVGGILWKSMWDAAESFILQDNTEKNFPMESEDNCPLCLQSIDNIAAARIKSFHDFIKDKTQQQAAQSKSLYKQKVKLIDEHSFSIETYTAVLDEVEDIQKNSKEAIIALCLQLSERKTEACKDEPNFDNEKLNTSILDWLKEHITILLEQEKAIKDDESLAKILLDLNNTIIEIEDKKVFSENKLNYISEISRLLKLKQLNDIRKMTATRSITQLSSSINQDSVTGVLVNAFEKELKDLGFSFFSVEAKTRGAKGNQLFKLKLGNANANNVVDIASEGEQKCLALAGFLSEIYADNRNSAVIFDDPVNSLDHRWRRKFAKRLATESQTRQIIVFTHDITFLKMLEEFTNGEATIRALTRNGKYSGQVLERPPWDTLRTKSRIGTIKQRLTQLRKMYFEGSHDSYSDGTKQLYGKMREAWERLIEELLIYEVVQRFDRRIQSQRLRHLIDIEQKDLDIIETAMTKCSTFLDGHDNASEFGVDIPPPDEVEADIAALDNYFIELKKRRK